MKNKINLKQKEKEETQEEKILRRGTRRKVENGMGPG